MNAQFLLRLLVMASCCASAQIVPQVASDKSPFPVTASEVYAHSRSTLVEIYTCDSKDQCAYGNGVLVSANGLIVSNAHLIGSQSVSATIKLTNGDTYKDILLLDTNEDRDLSLLKVRAVDLPYMELANSESIHDGLTVYSINKASESEVTLSQGIVSAVRLGEELSAVLAGGRVIQFTASASPSSGGPLIDGTGKMIGLVTSDPKEGRNLNLAIPSNYIRAMLSEPSQSNDKQLSPVSTANLSPMASSSSSIQPAAHTNRTIFISSDNDPTSVSEITKKLIKFGRIDLVTTPEEADLILVVTQSSQLAMSTGAGYQSSAVLSDARSHTQLWAETKGGGWSMAGYSNGRVGRLLGDGLVKFMASYLPKK